MRFILRFFYCGDEKEELGYKPPSCVWHWLDYIWAVFKIKIIK